jgi:hypothetical protein
MIPRVREQLVTTVILLFGCLGLAFRAYVISKSNGSNDFHIWLDHTAVLKVHGFLWAYGHTGDGTPYLLYNHPPLPGLYALFSAAHDNHDQHLFTEIFKIPSFLAEIMSAVLVGMIWRRRKNARAGAVAFSAYAFALGPIAVAAFHCNTDAVSAAFTLLACERSERDRPDAAGLALGAAMSIKLIPLLISPLLFFHARGWKKKARLIFGASIALIPYVPFASDLGTVAKATFGYAPPGEHWGLVYMLGMFADISVLHDRLTAARTFVVHYGKEIVIFVSLAAGALAAWNRRVSAYGGASIVLLSFLVFSPGFGVQYVIAVAPILFAYDLVAGFTYATISGLFVSLVYASFLRPNILPYESAFSSAYTPGPSMIGILTWGYCLLTLLRIVHKEWTGRRRA